MNCVFKTKNAVFKTRNCVSKTRNFVFQMMNCAGLGPAEPEPENPGVRSKICNSSAPLWRHPSFVDALADSTETKDKRLSQHPPGVANLYASCDLIGKALSQLASTCVSCTALQEAASALTDSMGLIAGLPAYSRDGARFCQYLDRVALTVTQMTVGQCVFLPGGWATGGRGGLVGVAVPLVLHRRPGGKFALAVCHTGQGSEGYLPLAPETTTGELLQAQSIALYDVSAELVANRSFWFVVFRMLVYPSKKNGPQHFYEKILPMMNKKPLLANKYGYEGLSNVYSDKWPEPASSGDVSHFQAVLEGVRHTLIWSGLLPTQANCVALFIRFTIVQWLECDLKTAPIRESDAVLVDAACKQMAEYAHDAGRDPLSPVDSTQLTEMQRAVHSIHEGIDSVLHAYEPPIVDASKLGGLPASASHFPLFGRLRRDVSADVLEGGSAKPQIELPVELTSMLDKVTNNREAGAAMRTCVKLCTRLDNQRDVVRNSFLHRVALIQHLFTRVIPLPLPHNLPESQTRCFWAQPLLYVDQADILRSLDMLCRHYSSASLSLTATRSFDAVRMLVMGCMACVADAVMRIVAFDDPSVMTLHYSGKAEGPFDGHTKPFGFEMGHFEKETETAIFTNPELNTARTQILDYFHQQLSFLDDDHTIFRFERSMTVGVGEISLLDQVCLAAGFARKMSDVQPDHTFAKYLCYEERDLIDSYPELAFFRDIVYFCKAFMAPTSDALPSLKQWRPRDAALHWKHKGKGEVSVEGFGQQLRAQAFDKDESSGGLLSKFKKKPRKPPSGGDPSNLVDEDVKTEEDILHVRHLPNFDGRLAGRNSELLLQYLTAPYLRIPLVMQFFSDQMRITALASDELQVVLDACLFEPGQWQRDQEKSLPETVPAATRDHLATPCGLLFNELVHAPDLLLEAIEAMVAFVVEMDEGKFSWNSSPYILYILRLLVKVEGFCQCQLEHAAWRAEDEVSGCSSKSYVRGLYCQPHALQSIKNIKTTIRSRLRSDFFPLVSGWCTRCTKEKLVRETCILHTHLAFIMKNVTDDELDHTAVKTLLTAQMFLHNNFKFDMDEQVGGSRADHADEGLGTGLGIDQTEVFDLFQKHRNKCMAWLESNLAECDSVMEEIERALTMTDIQEESQTVGGTGVSANQLAARHWISLPEPGYAGRFQPDTEIADRKKNPTPEFESYEDWILYMTTQEVETEMNVQLGTFTLKKQAMQVLPTQIARNADFEEIFGKTGAFAIQSAGVRKTENRTWLRLVGRRHDVHWWEAWCPHKNEKGEAVGRPESNCTRSYPKGLKPTESWVEKQLTPWLQPYSFSMRLCIQKDDCTDANMVRLTGYFLLDTDPNDGHPINQDEPMHELVVIRDPPAVHVYNIVEWCRRWQRQLVFSSSSVNCLHNMTPEPFVQGDHVGYKTGCIGEFITDTDGEITANPAMHWARDNTLGITRNVSAAFGVQTYVPRRFLRGILPDSLLNDYEFWQDETDEMIGYPMPHKRQDAVSTTIITVELLQDSDSDMSGMCNSHASSRVTRVAVTMVDAYDFKIDSSVPTLTLLNLMTSDPRSGLVTSQLRKLLLRLEDFSSILVWTEAVPGSDALSVDVVELPRLQLSFAVKEKDGEVKLYSNDHDGMFVSNTRSPRLLHLLDGLPTSLLLENPANEFSILVPAGTKPSRFESSVLTDRSNKEWLGNLGDVRHYLYPIHLSGTFLTASTLASSMYLMVWRLFTGAYGTAFKLADACLSDTRLSGEEGQIWQQIAEVEYDAHADACACRLKMSLVTMGCEDAMPCVWDVGTQLAMYADLRHHVSAACRLTHGEEFDLILIYGAWTNTLANRKAYLEAFARSMAEAGDAYAEIQYPSP